MRNQARNRGRSSRQMRLETLEVRNLLAVYLENFNDGPGGWDVLPDSSGSGSMKWKESGGVGDTGYIEGSRIGLSPNYYPKMDSAAANATGNLEAIYGNLINISYYGRVVSGVVAPRPISHEFFSALAAPNGWPKWVQPHRRPGQRSLRHRHCLVGCRGSGCRMGKARDWHGILVGNPDEFGKNVPVLRG